ncbi:MAG TPA: hypothetical protein DCZ94_20945 [Lentisphaeria bacterium]|nr:MAG: hypothetical protein A2X48_23150 [Lentisphaerae bacterium GWF2_49_21]HBC89414.1 hypothetical protein [Lentisphaeria bacterium]
MNMNRIITLLFLICFLHVILSAEESADYNAIAKCQQALVTRKVANGEFPESILEKALTLPPEQFVSEDEEKLVKKLFDQLGADKFEDREAATKELIEKHNASGYLKLLLKQTREPESAGRAKKIIDAWKEKNPDDEFLLKLKMWMNCPGSITKLKMHSVIYTPAQKHNKHQLLYDAVKGMSLDDFPSDDRINAIIFWMNSCQTKSQSLNVSFFRQLKDEEWRNKELLEAVRKALEDENSSFNGLEFEDLLVNIPMGIDLKDWLPMLVSSTTRKGAIAALLVKTGNKEALPDFIELLNQEWSSATAENGKIRGGGHSLYYSPFYQFEIFKIPAYRKFAPEILKGINEKFADDRIAYHDAYLNVVRYFAATDAGIEMLESLSSHKSPQTAIGACLMLYGQNGKDETLEKLLAALNAASPQDIMSNYAELADLLRSLRGKMLISPEKAGFYGKLIRSAGEAFMKNVLDADKYSVQKDAFDFFIGELLPFGLVAPERRKVIDMLAACTKFEWWGYPESAVRFLVQDAAAKGDSDKLLEQLAASAGELGAKPGALVLLVDFAMISGQYRKLEPMKGKLTKLLEKTDEKEKFPPQVKKACWILFPEAFISSPQPFEWGPDYLLLNGKGIACDRLAEKLDGQGKDYKAQLFRLSYGLEDADLSKINEVKEYDLFIILSEMAWKNPPPEKVMRDKLLDLCEKMKEAEYGWQVREFLKNTPGLIRKFGIRIGEIRSDNPMLMLLEADMALQRGDIKAYRESVRKARESPELIPTDYMRNDIRARETVLELADGVISDELKRRMAAAGVSEPEGGRYRLVNILYENGFTEKARELRKIVPKPDVYYKWELSECCLSWAWNEAIAGNSTEALSLAETALMNARSKEMSDYALMMRRLLKENPAELGGFLKALAIRRDSSKKAEYADAVAKVAEKAVDKDLKALSAFMAARLALASGKREEDVRKLWQLGAEAVGLHSGYCRDAMDAVPGEKTKFTVSSSWYSRDTMPKEMTPFTNSFGLCYKADEPCLTVKSLMLIGPYGIASASEKLQYFCDGSGYWSSIRDQGKAFVPGEWSAIIKYQDGIEYHQRTLLPYTVKK